MSFNKSVSPTDHRTVGGRRRHKVCVTVIAHSHKGVKVALHSDYIARGQEDPRTVWLPKSQIKCDMEFETAVQPKYQANGVIIELPEWLIIDKEWENDTIPA